MSEHSPLPMYLKPLNHWRHDEGIEFLARRLAQAGIPEGQISDVVDSGYYLTAGTSPGATASVEHVHDPFYGNKLSGIFSLQGFIDHLRGEGHTGLPSSVRRIRVRSQDDIDTVLADEHRARFLAQGSMSFRGQPREYKVRRRLPNLHKADAEGREISIMPGVYRQAGEVYSFATDPSDPRWLELYALALDPAVRAFPGHSRDLMLVEQHYAAQTIGLDLTFDISSAVFFATHRYSVDEVGLANLAPVPRGEHVGVIYLFRFGTPQVRRSEFLVEDFEVLRTNRPERILRQRCGLPTFHPFERNIATTEIDCVLELDADFEPCSPLTPEYMFPSAVEDSFYRRLLEIADANPDLRKHVAEYRWARHQSP